MAKDKPKKQGKTQKSTASRRRSKTQRSHYVSPKSSFSKKEPWILTHEGPVKRPLIKVLNPHSNQYTLFYRSSGLSNDIANLTGNTWFPLIGILTEENLAFFQDYREALVGKDNNGAVKPLEVGHLLKMSVLYQIYSQQKNQNTTSFMKRSFFTEEITNLLRTFFDYLVVNGYTEDVIKKDIMDYAKLTGKLHLYFSEVWQIVWSVSFSPESTFWKENPVFVQYIQKTYPPITGSFPFSSHELEEKIKDAPIYSLDSQEVLQFVSSKELTEPVKYIQQVIIQDTLFADMKDFTNYRDQYFRKMRTELAKSRIQK